MFKFAKNTLAVCLGIILFFILLILMVLGSCDYEIENPNVNSAEKISEIKQTFNPEKEFKIGDEIKLGKYMLIVNEMKKNDGEEYSEPDNGMEFIIVNITLKNDGINNINYASYNFKLQNSRGQVLDNDYYTLSNYNAIGEGELIPDGCINGDILFQAPVNDKELILAYEPEWFSNKIVKIVLN